MIVVDSSVWIPLLSNIETEATRLLDLADEMDIIVGDIVLLELLQGARSDRDAARIEQRLSVFGVLPMLSPEIAVRAAGNYRKLRQLGFTVRKTPDLIIATYCLENGHVLLHQDRDFSGFEKHLGLKVLHPA